jgi:hypothetical protein
MELVTVNYQYWCIDLDLEHAPNNLGFELEMLLVGTDDGTASLHFGAWN